ncbi:MAG: hypothetical protein ABI288_06325 [Ginsengibacter sp.]
MKYIGCGIGLSWCLLISHLAIAQYSDFSNASIYAPRKSEPQLRKAVEVLQQVIEERTQVRLPVLYKPNFDDPGKSSIIIVTEQQVAFLPASFRKELLNLRRTEKDGYKIIFLKGVQKKLVIVGHDERGALYGVGHLLRKAQLRNDEVLVPEGLNLSSSPAYPIRGHQLAYRPNTNAYDAWTVKQFDHYIRDLAIFGNNSIEIVPPETDDEPTSALMKLSPEKMMVEQSRICKSYGLDVWMWYPNMGKDYTSANSIQKELDKREKVFSVLPKLDAVFVPAGDPGDLAPDVLFDWLAKVAVVLHKYHPNAKIWVSPQAMHPTKKWYAAFYKRINSGYSWLGGVVYGPWVKESISAVRQSVNKHIPIRRYPDITHNLSSQYPVPKWDQAYAMTLGRESYNPRPEAEKHIHNLFARYAEGSISYSEGINDDVNKFIWSDQNWNPNIPAIETVRDYARLFISPDYTDQIAQGILALENNWKGPLLVNEGVDRTLHQWHDMERNAPPNVLSNFRFQMCLLRAYYDAYVRQRLINETALEQKAKSVLTVANETGADNAINNATKILNQAHTDPVRKDLRTRCFALADSLFNNIGSQLSVKKYGAKRGRGDFLDDIDMPLNNVSWLLSRFSEVKKMATESSKLESIDQILNRTNPGPGGFYDDFGSFNSWDRIVSRATWAEDPGGNHSPIIDFGVSLKGVDKETVPLAWRSQITTHYNTPLELKYDNLDPKGTYVIKVTYTGRFHSLMKLVADDKYLVHDFMQTGDDQAIYEFPVPPGALSDGVVKFTWTCDETGRGAQVAEVWLIKK